MSQFLLLRKNLKLESIMDGFNDSLYECWTNIHGLLFWVVSVIINRWNLKEENVNTMVMDDNFIFGNYSEQSSNSVPNTLHNQPNYNIKPNDIQLKKPEKKPPPLIIQTATIKEKKSIVKKQSLFLVKNHMLSWKQKLSQKSPLTYEQVSPTTKRSFLRRLSSGNNVIYSDTSTNTSKSEPPSPTVSKFKSISFKLKKHDEDNIIDNKSRLSLSNFKRKPSIDTLN